MTVDDALILSFAHDARIQRKIPALARAAMTAVRSHKPGCKPCRGANKSGLDTFNRIRQQLALWPQDRIDQLKTVLGTSSLTISYRDGKKARTVTR